MAGDCGLPYVPAVYKVDCTFIEHIAQLSEYYVIKDLNNLRIIGPEKYGLVPNQVLKEAIKRDYLKHIDSIVIINNATQSHSAFGIEFHYTDGTIDIFAATSHEGGPALRVWEWMCNVAYSNLSPDTPRRVPAQNSFV